MNEPPDQLHPMAIAMHWVGRITTITLEMVLPGLAGHWLDDRYGTSFLALVGFAFGLTVSIWHLIQISKSGVGKNFPPSKDNEKVE